MKKILVITMFTDESQMPDLTRSLLEQKGVAVDHKIIAGKDAVTAERILYETSRSSRCQDFDAVIKIDADMTLAEPSALNLILGWLSRNLEFDRISLPVRDYYQGQFITGVHTWRPSAVPLEATISQPNPDAWINTIRGRLLYGLRRNLVDHGFNPSSSQAIRYGLHRGIKARINGPSHRHWIAIKNLENQYKRRKGERGISYALLGSLIGIGAIKMPIEPSWSWINHEGPGFREIHDFCEQQEKDGFPALCGQISVFRHHEKIFNSPLAIAKLALRSAKSKLLIERDRLFRDDISSYK